MTFVMPTDELIPSPTRLRGAKLDRHYTKRDEIMKVLHRQGLCTDEGID